jgi:uncharacterized protein (TIGR02391 family)
MQVREKTLKLLMEKRDEISELEKTYDQANFDSWHMEAKLALEDIFGEDSDKVREFDSFDGRLSVFWNDESDHEHLQRKMDAYFSDLRLAKSFLTGIIRFLERIAAKTVPQQAAEIAKTDSGSWDGYSFHPIIAEVSGPLFKDGHYRDAVRAAFIEVIDQVKNKTGRRTASNGRRELDGDDLMNATFGQASQAPRVRWTNLSTQADQDFQQGMMYLFKGVVGLRNEKGHMNVEQKDRGKAFEYLSLASLLLRQLDEALLDESGD